MLWRKGRPLIRDMYIVMIFVCLNLEERWGQCPWQLSCLLGNAFAQAAGGNWSSVSLWMASYCTGLILSLHINPSVLRTVNLFLFNMPLYWNKYKAPHNPSGIFLKSTSRLMVKMQDAKMRLSCSPVRSSQRLGALPQGASTQPFFRPCKGYGGISLWGTPTELHGGSSGRIKGHGLAESGLPPAPLRYLHGHHRLEQHPHHPGSWTLRRAHSGPWQPEIWNPSKLIAIVFLNTQENSWEQNWWFDTLFSLAFRCN